MTKTITPFEVGQLLSEAQEKINHTLSCEGELTPEDYQQIAKWRDDVQNIFTVLVDEMSWVASGKPMLPDY